MTGLPTALAPWSAELTALDHGVAVSLGPMIHRLDELVGRHASASAHDGIPDGYDGLAARGHPDRILATQWLLASDVPEEFLRRAAGGELLYLAQARQHDADPGRSVLLTDCGPTMLGAPRLLQLALAVVLARRAAAAGRELRLGVLGRAPGLLRDGDLPALLDAWLRARTAATVGPDDVEAWLAELDRPQDAWVVTTPSTARALATAPGARPRVVTVAETDWTPNGPSALDVRLGGERVHLPLPEPAVAVRVLRGDGWRRRPLVAPVPVRSAVRHPALPGYAPVLLARGEDAGVLVRQQVPEVGRPAGKLRRFRFDGDVLAASVLGRRLVLLLVAGGDVRVHVVGGKDLAGLHGHTVPTDDLGLTAQDVAAVLDGPPVELWFQRGPLVVRLPSGWWSLRPDRPPRRRPDLLAVVPSSVTDVCGVVRADGPGLRFDPGSGRSVGYRRTPVEGQDRVVLGAGAIAWPAGMDRWLVADLPEPWGPLRLGRDDLVTGPLMTGTPVTVPDGGTVLGLARLGEEPALVVASAAQLILRLVSAQRSRVLRRWSGGPAVVHGGGQVVAVTRPDGTIEVGDLGSGNLHLRVEPA